MFGFKLIAVHGGNLGDSRRICRIVRRIEEAVNSEEFRREMRKLGTDRAMGLNAKQIYYSLQKMTYEDLEIQIGFAQGDNLARWMGDGRILVEVDSRRSLEARKAGEIMREWLRSEGFEQIGNEDTKAVPAQVGLLVERIVRRKHPQGLRDRIINWLG